MSEQRDPYGQPEHVQPGPGLPQYGASQYGVPRYEVPRYAAAPYGQPPSYVPAPGSRPAKPGSVVTAAVLGFVWGAIGVLVTFLFVIAGIGGRSLVDSFAGGGGGEAELGARFVTGVAVFFAVLALLWTVSMIWGGILALTGRSRVLLIVGGSVAVAATGLYFVVALANASAAGTAGVTVTLLLLAVSILIVVLLCLRAAGQFFAAHRALRVR